MNIDQNAPSHHSVRTPYAFRRRSWWAVLRRVARQYGEDRVALTAAGAAFFSLLSLVPSLAALVAIYGLVFDRDDVADQMTAIGAYLPSEVQTIVSEQLTRLTSEPSGALGFAFVVTLAMSLWSASGATKALMQGLNIVYGEDEKRSFVKKAAVALAITVSGIALVIILIAASIVGPEVAEALFLNSLLAKIIGLIALAAMVWLALIALYRWGPSRRYAKWRWLSPGTWLAVVGLIGFTLAFSWFAETFSRYAAYGSIGAVIAFMTWAWVSFMIVLVGGELNAELERQTAEDTTVGRDRPMGQRGAVVADTVVGGEKTAKKAS